MRKTVWMSVWGCAALIGLASVPVFAADGDSHEIRFAPPA